MHRVGVVQGRSHQGVAALVVGGDPPLLLVHQPAALLRAGHHPVDGLVQVVVVDQRGVAAGGQQRRLVQHVRQVGAGEARGPPGDREQVDVDGQRLALGMDLEDVVAALQVGALDRDLPVEAARAQQGRVEDVRPVRRRDEDDPTLDVEPVHLHEQLVERLLPLVVPAAETGAAVPAHRVDLVDEDDRRGVGLGLLEQVADPARADADEHLHEVRARDGVERHARLAGDGAGEQRLARPRRAVQEDALRDLGADRLELGGLLQELLDLLELLHRLVDPGDVGERGLGHVLGGQLGLGLAEVHDPGAAALHLVHQEEEQDDDQHDRQQADQQAHQQGLLGLDLVEPLRRRVLAQLLGQVGAGGRDVLRGDPRRGAALQGQLDALLAVDEPSRLHVAGVDGPDDLGGVDLLEPGGRREQLGTDQHGQDHQGDPQDRTSEVTPHIAWGAGAPPPPDECSPPRWIRGIDGTPGRGDTAPSRGVNVRAEPGVPRAHAPYTCGARVPTNGRLR